MPDPVLFALRDAADFGLHVSARLQTELSKHEEREFEDGEHKSRPLVNVRGRDVYVMQSLHTDAESSVNDRLIRLLFFIGALKESAADRVTAVIPYLCYARKDQRTKPRDPVTTKYVAKLFETVGLDAMLTIDVHNVAAFQNAFRCQTDHLEAARLFADYFQNRLRDEQVVVVSPDIGGVKRADRLREILADLMDRPVATASMEKKRSSGVVSGDRLIGDVKGRAAIIVDDLISTGTTMARGVRECRRLGATQIYAAATHGLFIDGAKPLMSEPGLRRVVVTNTVPPFRLSPSQIESELEILDAAPLFAAAIHRMHEDGSLVELLAQGL